MIPKSIKIKYLKDSKGLLSVNIYLYFIIRFEGGIFSKEYFISLDLFIVTLNMIPFWNP